MLTYLHGQVSDHIIGNLKNPKKTGEKKNYFFPKKKMSIAELNTDVALFKRSRSKVTEVNDVVNDDNEFSPEDVTEIHEQLGFPEPPSSMTKEDPDYDSRLKLAELICLMIAIVGIVFLCGRWFM
jgi:hypothetical protein